MERRAAREAALIILFQVDVGRAELGSAIEHTFTEIPVTEQARDFALSLVRGVLANLEKIDETIERFSRDWKLERLARTDRAVLRIAVYEMLFRDDIPVGASINEAVELAKMYGGAESGRFVNGILGNVARTVRDASGGDGEMG